MSDRVEVRKTYKLFVGGKFPRSESGRSYVPAAAGGVNVTRGSRKDLRDAVTAARKGLPGWSQSTGYLQGQILYRLAEMLETRRRSMVDEIGGGPAEADAEVTAAIDTITYYAGLPDKLPSLLGSQNGVSGPFFNFSTVEPTGVIGVVAPDAPALAGLMALVLPLLAGGNTVVALVSEANPLPGLALGELLAVSDVPAGAVNLLAGKREELVPEFAAHRDLDGLLLAGAPAAAPSAAAADSVKRVRYAGADAAQWSLAAPPGVAWVEPFVEVKTFWHPVAP
ncbi:MAG: aldehyde dehydrogenase family protein [Planctomycetota bacterium]